VAGTCECRSEPSGTIKCREFLDLLKTGSFSKRTAPWSQLILLILCVEGRPYKKGKEVKFAPIHVVKTYRGSRGVAPLINLGARWRLVFNVTSRPPYPRVRTPVSTEQEAVWAPEPFWTFRRTRKCIAFAGV